MRRQRDRDDTGTYHSETLHAVDLARTIDHCPHTTRASGLVAAHASGLDAGVNILIGCIRMKTLVAFWKDFFGDESFAFGGLEHEPGYGTPTLAHEVAICFCCVIV